MTQYIVDSNDGATETLFIRYQQERGSVQAVAGQMYQAISQSEAAYVGLGALLAEDGELSTLAEYHTALQAPVVDAVDLLRASMEGVLSFMRQMQAAMPEGVQLFPNVPRGE